MTALPQESGAVGGATVVVESDVAVVVDFDDADTPFTLVSADGAVASLHAASTSTAPP